MNPSCSSISLVNIDEHCLANIANTKYTLLYTLLLAFLGQALRRLGHVFGCQDPGSDGETGG
jgi:hypothetical protein